MILDARALPADDVIETDVCVVGGGVAGITLARELAGRAFRVCLLESGGFEPDDEVQDLARGENLGYRYYPLEITRRRQYGGTSGCWELEIGGRRAGVRLRPLDAVDFERREGIPYSGWPFDRAHLLPFYQRAQALFQQGPFAYEVEDWEDAISLPRLALSPHRVRTVMFQLLARDPFLQTYRDLIAATDNVRLYHHANVLEVEIDPPGPAVARLRAASMPGRPFSVRAQLYVLAAGGIEVPRLLLLSNKTRPEGLGNQHDLVGRFFMEHPHFLSGKLIPQGPELFTSAGLYQIREARGVHVMGYLSLSEEVVRRERMLNYAVSLWPTASLRPVSLRNVLTSRGFASLLALRSALRRGRKPPGLIRHLGHIVADADELALFALEKAGWGRLSRRLRRLGGAGEMSAAPVAFQLHNMTEQVPNPESRVTLAAARDAFGQRRAALDWQLSEMDVDSIRRAQAILHEELVRAGLGRIQMEIPDTMPPEGITGGFHHMGTTRMHRDPRQGVVDEYGRVHGIPNLFVAGPSVFPTCGYANPTLTIVALAIRLADHLNRQMA